MEIDMETIQKIKQLPKQKPVNFGTQCAAGELVSVHIQIRRVYGKSIPTYTPRTERGRIMTRRWCMRRVPWVFTKEALKEINYKD